MTYTLGEALESFGETCPKEFSSLEVIFVASWFDYEESAFEILFKFFDEIHSIKYQYCVMFEPEFIHNDSVPKIIHSWNEREENNINFVHPDYEHFSCIQT